MEKEEQNTRFKILNLVLSYEVSKGHLKWKVADVSRKLKVSRSLIYYHFGQTKKDILNSCYDMVAEKVYGLGDDISLIRDFENRVLEKALLKTQKIYLQNPAIVAFYHRWRLEPSETQKRILEIESKYQKKLRMAFPELDAQELLALQVILHGVVTSAFASPASIRVVVAMVQRLLEKNS